MIVELSPLKFSDRTFYILSNERQCDVWIEAVVFTHLIKVTWRKFHCRQISGFTSPPTSGLGTPLIRRGRVIFQEEIDTPLHTMAQDGTTQWWGEFTQGGVESIL